MRVCACLVQFPKVNLASEILGIFWFLVSASKQTVQGGRGVSVLHERNLGGREEPLQSQTLLSIFPMVAASYCCSLTHLKRTAVSFGIALLQLLRCSPSYSGGGAEGTCSELPKVEVVVVGDIVAKLMVNTARRSMYVRNNPISGFSVVKVSGHRDREAQYSIPTDMALVWRESSNET